MTTSGLSGSLSTDPHRWTTPQKGPSNLAPTSTASSPTIGSGEPMCSSSLKRCAVSAQRLPNFELIRSVTGNEQWDVVLVFFYRIIYFFSPKMIRFSFASTDFNASHKRTLGNKKTGDDVTSGLTNVAGGTEKRASAFLCILHMIHIIAPSWDTVICTGYVTYHEIPWRIPWKMVILTHVAL